jgi:hypothetical protein
LLSYLKLQGFFLPPFFQDFKEWPEILPAEVGKVLPQKRKGVVPGKRKSPEKGDHPSHHYDGAKKT